MDRVLVTGATGFLGKSVVERLLGAGHPVNMAGRHMPQASLGKAVLPFAVGAIGANTDWRAALEGCRSVVHLAAQLPAAVPDSAFVETNDRGTQALVRQAREAGVSTIVFVSSVFVVSGHSSPRPITDDDPPAPQTIYARTKLAGEEHVRGFASLGGTGIVLRVPIIYGARARGNWSQLQRLAATGAPLPFAAVTNRRTMVARENLADAIVHLISAERMPLVSGSFLLSDGAPVSLSEILRSLRDGMGLPHRLFRVHPAVLSVALRALGRGSMAESLLGDLEVDSTRFCRTFGWSPPISPHEAILRSGREFLSHDGR